MRKKTKNKRGKQEKKKIAEKMALIKEGDHPEAYIHKLEEAMREAEIPQREWPHRLRPLLTGTALSAYVNDVPEEAKRDWDLLRRSS